MGKMTIELRKPQHLSKGLTRSVSGTEAQEGRKSLPAFFKFLLLVSYALCGVAIWFVAQIYLKHG